MKQKQTTIECASPTCFAHEVDPSYMGLATMSLDGCQTERLRFHRISGQDNAFILSLLNEPGYIAYIGDRGLRTTEDATKYINDSLGYSQEGLGFYKLTRLEDGAAIGIAGIVLRDFLDIPDVGYALFARFEGFGYASEAARRVLTFASSELALEKVGAIVSPENTTSVRVLDKLGMHFVRAIEYPNEKDPVHLYELALPVLRP